MKIIFINNLRLPTEKAYGQSIASMASALAQVGAEVEVIGRSNNQENIFFDFYNLPANFKFKTLVGWNPLPPKAGRFGDYLNRLFFLLSLRRQKFSPETIFVTRQPEIAWFLSWSKYKVVFDAHRFPERWGWFLIRLIKRVKFVAANSQGTASAFERGGFYRLKVLPNGVDLDKFNLPPKPTPGRSALYLGHLYHWKGVEVIIAAASLAPDINFKIAGGPEAERQKLVALVRERGLSNVEFIGIIPPAEVPAYLKSADVLIYSARADSVEAKFYTSPIKLFEYLAAGVPTVVADLPSVREIVNEYQVTFYTPSKAASLAVALHTILADPTAAAAKAKAGRELMANYTWQRRASNLIAEIKLTKPPFLAVGTFLADYPRNQLLLRSLASLTNLTVVNYYQSYFPNLRLWWKLVRWSQTGVLVVQPASQLAPVIALAKFFRTAPTLADAFTSIYDTLVMDRALASTRSIKAKWYWLLDYLLIRVADGFIFDTVEHQNYFSQYLKTKYQKVSAVVPVSVDIRLFDRLPAQPLPTKKFNVMFYGKYIPLQGVEFIIEAAKLLGHDNNIHFTLIGSGQTFAHSKNLINQLRLKNITLLPKTNYLDLISLIKGADILLGVFGQSNKTLRVIPNKVIESLAAGRPLITGTTPAIKRFFTDGQELCLVPVANSQALADKIIDLKNDPALANRIAAAGHLAVSQAFSQEAMTKALSQLFSQL